MESYTTEPDLQMQPPSTRNLSSCQEPENTDLQTRIQQEEQDESTIPGDLLTAFQRLQKSSFIGVDLLLRLLPAAGDPIDEPLMRASCITLCSLINLFIHNDVVTLCTKAKHAPMPHFARLCVFAIEFSFLHEACRRFGLVDSSFHSYFRFPEKMKSAIDYISDINRDEKMLDHEQIQENGIWRFPNGLFERTWSLMKKVNKEKVPYNRLEIGWGFMMAGEISIEWKQDRFWLFLLKNKPAGEPVQTLTSPAKNRTLRRRWSNVTAVESSANSPNMPREPPRGAVRNYGLRMLMKAGDTAANLTQCRPDSPVKTRFGEFAFLLACCMRLVPQPMSAQCRDAGKKLLIYLSSVDTSVPDRDIYCDLLWAVHAKNILRCDDVVPLNQYMVDIHEEWLKFDVQQIRLQVIGGRNEAIVWEQFLSAALAVWSLIIVPDIDKKKIKKFIKKWEAHLFQAVDRAMKKNMILTMSTILLSQVIYAVTHLVFIATDYGKTFASFGDGKYLNGRYGVFLDDAALRLMEDMQQDNICPSVTEPLMEILLSIRLIQSSMPDIVMAKLRQIGESEAEIPGLFRRPEGWKCPDENISDVGGAELLWEDLHRSVTCIMGVSSWIREFKSLKRRPDVESLFSQKSHVDVPDDTGIRRRRSAAKTHRRQSYERIRNESQPEAAPESTDPVPSVIDSRSSRRSARQLTELATRSAPSTTTKAPGKRKPPGQAALPSTCSTAPISGEVGVALPAPPSTAPISVSADVSEMAAETVVNADNRSASLRDGPARKPPKRQQSTVPASQETGERESGSQRASKTLTMTREMGTQTHEVPDANRGKSDIREAPPLKKRLICRANRIATERTITKFYREGFRALPEEPSCLVPDGVVCLRGLANQQLSRFADLLKLSAQINAGSASICVWETQDIELNWNSSKPHHWEECIEDVGFTVANHLLPVLKERLGLLKLWSAPTGSDDVPHRSHLRTIFVRVHGRGGSIKKRWDIEFWEINYPKHMGSLPRTYTVWVVLENSTTKPVLEFQDGLGAWHAVSVVPGDVFVFNSAIVYRSPTVSEGRRVSVDFSVTLDDDRY